MNKYIVKKMVEAKSIKEVLKKETGDIFCVEESSLEEKPKSIGFTNK